MDLGGYQVYFCSGEFLMRDDALEQIAYARSQGLAVTVTSNGILLDRSMIDAMDRAGLTKLIVSLDSAEPARHDELRGVEGCFDKATNGMYPAGEVAL